MLLANLNLRYIELLLFEFQKAIRGIKKDLLLVSVWYLYVLWNWDFEVDKIDTWKCWSPLRLTSSTMRTKTTSNVICNVSTKKKVQNHYKDQLDYHLNRKVHFLLLRHLRTQVGKISPNFKAEGTITWDEFNLVNNNKMKPQFLRLPSYDGKCYFDDSN